MGVDTTTADLVRTALEGDRDAFGVLVESHWDRLVRLARSVVGDAEAEDVANLAVFLASFLAPATSAVLRGWNPGCIARAESLLLHRRGTSSRPWKWR